jgi:hypothetical protein
MHQAVIGPEWLDAAMLGRPAAALAFGTRNGFSGWQR